MVKILNKYSVHTAQLIVLNFLSPRHDLPWIDVWGAEKFTSRWVNLMLSIDILPTLQPHISSAHVFTKYWYSQQAIAPSSALLCALNRVMLEWIRWRWCAGRAVIWRQWTVRRQEQEGPGNFRQVQLPLRSRFSASQSQSLHAIEHVAEKIACNACESEFQCSIIFFRRLTYLHGTMTLHSTCLARVLCMLCNCIGCKHHARECL